jgi:hypothetical protein
VSSEQTTNGQTTIVTLHRENNNNDTETVIVNKCNILTMLTWANVTCRLITLTVLALEDTETLELLLRGFGAASFPSWIGQRVDDIIMANKNMRKISCDCEDGKSCEITI